MTTSLTMARPNYWRLSLLTMGLAFACLAVVAEARSLAEIQKTKELRVCIAFVSPIIGKAEPTGCRDNCKTSGDTPDLAMSFATTLGSDMKPKFVSVGWEEQFLNKEGKLVREDSYTPELLASGTCDLYATGLAKNPWRSKKLDFVMVNPSRMEVVVQKSRKGEFSAPPDLKGKTAATYKETAYHTWLLEQNQSAYKANPVRIEFVADEEESLKALDDGRVDFTILVAEDAIPSLNRQYKNSAVAFPVGPVLEMGWAFRKQDKDLQAAADKFLRAQRAQKDSLLNKQFKNLYDMSVNEFSEMVSQMK